MKLMRFLLFVATILLCGCATDAASRVVAVSPARPPIVVAPLAHRVVIAPVRPWWAPYRMRYWR